MENFYICWVYFHREIGPTSILRGKWNLLSLSAVICYFESIIAGNYERIRILLKKLKISCLIYLHREVYPTSILRGKWNLLSLSAIICYFWSIITGNDGSVGILLKKLKQIMLYRFKLYTIIWGVYIVHVSLYLCIIATTHDSTQVMSVMLALSVYSDIQ